MKFRCESENRIIESTYVGYQTSPRRESEWVTPRSRFTLAPPSRHAQTRMCDSSVASQASPACRHETEHARDCPHVPRKFLPQSQSLFRSQSQRPAPGMVSSSRSCQQASGIGAAKRAESRLVQTSTQGHVSTRVGPYPSRPRYPRARRLCHFAWSCGKGPRKGAIRPKSK